MKKLTITWFLFTFITLFSPLAASTIIELVPQETSIEHGDSVFVDLNISELGDFSPDSLGGFIIDVLYDSNVLSFTNVEFGDYLGSLGLGEAFTFYSDNGAGLLSLDEVSFLFDIELDSLQPSEFTLATIEFKGIAVGTSILDIDFVDLSDAEGQLLFVDTISPAQLISVPEPATFLLFLISWASIGLLPKHQ